MIKKIIMKLIRKNADLREFIINGCIVEDLILPEQKSEILSNMKLHTTVNDEHLKNKVLVFNNCLFINTKIENNKIEGEFKIVNPYNTYIINNTGLDITDGKAERVEIPGFMRR